MAISIVYPPVIHSKACAKPWHVADADLRHVGGKTFVRLARNGKGIAKFCFADNPNVPDPVPPTFSLTASEGYGQLVALRNAMAIDAKVDAAMSQRGLDSDLFRAAIEKQVRQATLTKAEVAKAKSDGSYCTITMPDASGTINCLAPVWDRNNLWVEVDKDQIDRFVTFLKKTPWKGSMQKVYREPGSLRQRVRRNGKVVFYKTVKMALPGQTKWLRCDANGEVDVPESDVEHGAHDGGELEAECTDAEDAVEPESQHSSMSVDGVPCEDGLLVFEE